MSYIESCVANLEGIFEAGSGENKEVGWEQESLNSEKWLGLKWALVLLFCKEDGSEEMVTRVSEATDWSWEWTWESMEMCVC